MDEDGLLSWVSSGWVRFGDQTIILQINEACATDDVFDFEEPNCAFGNFLVLQSALGCFLVWRHSRCALTSSPVSCAVSCRPCGGVADSYYSPDNRFKRMWEGSPDLQSLSFGCWVWLALAVIANIAIAFGFCGRLCITEESLGCSSQGSGVCCDLLLYPSALYRFVTAL